MIFIRVRPALYARHYNIRYVDGSLVPMPFLAGEEKNGLGTRLAIGVRQHPVHPWYLRHCNVYLYIHIVCTHIHTHRENHTMSCMYILHPPTIVRATVVNSLHGNENAPSMFLQFTHTVPYALSTTHIVHAHCVL